MFGVQSLKELYYPASMLNARGENYAQQDPLKFLQSKSFWISARISSKLSFYESCFSKKSDNLLNYFKSHAVLPVTESITL